MTEFKVVGNPANSAAESQKSEIKHPLLSILIHSCVLIGCRSLFILTGSPSFCTEFSPYCVSLSRCRLSPLIRKLEIQHKDQLEMLVVHCHSVINITGVLTEQNNNLLQQSTHDVATDHATADLCIESD